METDNPIRALRQRAVENAILPSHRPAGSTSVTWLPLTRWTRSFPSQVTDEPTANSLVTNTISLIQSLIPKERAFTVTDMVGWLEAAQPGQKFNEPTIRTYISRLSSRGVLKRLYKNGRNYTRWVSTDSFKKLGPVETMPMVDLVAEVLGEASGPMRQVEIVVCLREQGYRPDVTPVTLSRAVGNTCRRHPERFKRESDGRWTTR